MGGGVGGGGLFNKQRHRIPRDHERQNSQFRAVVKEFGLNKSQSRQLHDEISGKGYGYWEIYEIAEALFGK